MSELPIGTVHHEAKMQKTANAVPVSAVDKQSHDYRNSEITADYVNKKMEGLMSALFDTIGENEERIKDLEEQVWRLTEKLNGS